MNTKLYKMVYNYATDLLAAAENDDEEKFARLYSALEALCYDNEYDVTKNHPVQWETLADFTDDIDEALSLYRKALVYAIAIEAHDYMASIRYAMAKMLYPDGNPREVLFLAQQASESAKKTDDVVLQREIKTLLKALK